MSFKDIKGQPFAVRLLKKAISSNRLAHAYLFYGPDGVGKRFTAWEFAKVLNCPEGGIDSCDRCSTCVRIAQNKHPDVLWIYPIGKSRQIRIEQIRELQKFVSFKPYEARYKVCIIVDAHTLNIEAGNAFLKTLEEPPPNSIIILITHSREALLPTIRSRTQDVQFFYLSEDNISGLLKKMGFSNADALLYSRLGMGSLGRALSLKNEEILNQRKFILDIFAMGPLKKMGALMDRIGEIQDRLDRFMEMLERHVGKGESIEDKDSFIAGEYKRQVEEILDLILSWYRDILVYKSTHKDEIILNKDYIERIRSWSDILDMDELIRRIEVVEDIRGALGRQVGLKLLLQVMFLELGMIYV